MVNDIIQAIAIKLKSLYGDGYKVYDENVRQGLKEPCFFIQLITPIATPRMGTRKKITYGFDVSYFPKEGRGEMHSVGDQLIYGLEYITLPSGAKVRGTNMSYEIVDGVLHFLVSFTVFTMIEYNEDNMEVMQQINMGTKEQ